MTGNLQVEPRLIQSSPDMALHLWLAAAAGALGALGAEVLVTAKVSLDGLLEWIGGSQIPAVARL